jgi:hypothetical protein
MLRPILAITIALGVWANASLCLAQETDAMTYADTMRKSSKSHIVEVKGKTKETAGRHAGKGGSGKKKRRA